MREAIGSFDTVPLEACKRRIMRRIKEGRLPASKDECRSRLEGWRGVGRDFLAPRVVLCSPICMQNLLHGEADTWTS